MITARKFIEELVTEDQELLEAVIDGELSYTSALDTVENFMQEYARKYARLAIIEDRKNVANHAIVIQDKILYDGLLLSVVYKVDKISILDTPQIELP